MIINLKFFNKMRDIMSSGSFQPEDYNQEELEILFENIIIIYSKYCGNNFRSGVIEYFTSNRNLNIDELQSSRLICEKFKVPEERSLERLRKKLSKKYAPEEAELISDIMEYYHAWGADSVHIIYALSLTPFFELLFEITGSKEGISKILDPILSFKAWDKLVESVLNIGWGGLQRIQKFASLDQEEKDILRKIATYTTLNDSSPIINNMISLANLDEERNQFFESLKKENIGDRTLEDIIKNDDPNSGSQEIIQQAFVKLSEILTMDDEMVKERAVGLGIFAENNAETLALYIKKYNMPRDIFDQLLRDLGGLSREYTPKDSGAGSLFSNIETLQLSQKVGGKKLEASFLPSGDPVALFIGKMTKSCQFYSGDSSDTAVMPFYKDSNTGVIVIKAAAKIGAASFVWVCRDSTGKPGMVLDSIEHLPEMRKIIPEFLEKLSEILNKKGMDLYLGTGGSTPSLAYQAGYGVTGWGAMEGGKEEPLPTLSRDYDNIKPISQDYKPYYDSASLYKIAPIYKLSLSKSKDLSRGTEGCELWKEKMTSKADEIGATRESIETLVTKLPNSFLDNLSKRFTDNSTEFLRWVFGLEQESFTKICEVILSDDII
ncbi:MAG: hypothetical protein EB127_07930, partial [Alphaproteobacteria bacterium]|nr:hypothetical protein [Alphaproteobacteria bacterium]